MTRARRSNIDWSELTPWDVTCKGLTFVLKVATTAVETYTAQTVRDRNVTFTVHGTENNRVIGYSLVARPASGARPDFSLGAHYVGCFYSRLVDLAKRQGRTIEILYHDQNVRLLAFGTKPASRDYLLVLRNRSD